MASAVTSTRPSSCTIWGRTRLSDDREIEWVIRVRLAFEGKTLDLPPQAQVDVAYALATAGPFRPSDLPGGLDEAGRLVLVSRLVREGFLRIAQAGDAGSSA